MQMGSQHAAMAAGLNGQRYNDLTHLGPGQKSRLEPVMNVIGSGRNPGMRSYNSQPQL